jgi:hypothetical protein
MTSIIARAEWGAQHPDGFGDRAVGALDKWLHHTVTAAPAVDAPLTDDVAAMHVLEDEGQARFGAGISYSFVIPPSGRIFEGISVGRIGAHTYARNRTSVGIALIGNYNDLEVSAPQSAALVWLLQHGVAQGWWGLPTLTGGHRDVFPTACPGGNAYGQIPIINAAAFGSDAFPVANPAPAASVPTPVDSRQRNADGSLTITEDGRRGFQTISRWQDVMGTPVDGTISHPRSALIVADQTFLNSVVPAGNIRDLTGADALAVDGDEGPRTIKVRQFWLFNRLASDVFGRPARGDDFDGSAGPDTTTLHQHALNAASVGAQRY